MGDPISLIRFHTVGILTRFRYGGARWGSVSKRQPLAELLRLTEGNSRGEASACTVGEKAKIALVAAIMITNDVADSGSILVAADMPEEFSSDKRSKVYVPWNTAKSAPDSC